MAHTRLGSSPVLSGTVTMPRQGVWHADLVLDAPVAPSGRVTLTLGASLRLEGTVVASSVHAGETTARVVAGAGTLGRELGPRWYQGAPLGLPLRDLVEEAGERLSSACDADVLAVVLEPGWGRARGPAAEALGRLLEGTGATWRFLPDGTLWVGKEAWAPARGMADLVVLEDSGGDGRMVVVSEAPTLTPGQQLQGRKVSLVEYSIVPDKLRVEVWIERKAPGVGDRIGGALVSLIESLVRRRTRYLEPTGGVVVGQDSAGRLDIKLDGDDLPPLTSVPIRTPAPGWEVTVSEGTRVLVVWEGGDPRRPIATLWDGAGLKSLKVRASETVELDPDAGLPAARQGDMVASGGLTTFIVLGAPGAVGPAPLGVPMPVMWVDPTKPYPPSPILFGMVTSGNPKVKT